MLWATILLLAFLVGYPFFVYPILLRLAVRCFSRDWVRGKTDFKVSLIIAAYNEEMGIADKLNNVNSSEPASRHPLETIVVSDGSTDATESIVREQFPGVRLIATGTRGGKQIALNRAVEESKGEILVFTDVGALARPDALAKLVRNFADASVGAVNAVVEIERHGRAQANAPEGDNGEGRYLGHDANLRILEGKLWSVTGCCGPLYAVRRSCFRPFSASVASDFSSALDAVACGYRAVVEPEAVCVSRSAATYRREFWRKLRTVVGGMDSLHRSGVLGWGMKFPCFYWMLWSHKIVRWLGPVACLAVFGVLGWGAGTGESGMRELVILGLITFGVGFFAALLSEKRSLPLPLRLLSFACLSMAAGVYAWVQFLTGRKYVTWSPTHRPRILTRVAEEKNGSEQRRRAG